MVDKLNRMARLIRKGVKSVLHDGVRATYRKTRGSLKQQENFKQFGKLVLTPSEERL